MYVLFTEVRGEGIAIIFLLFLAKYFRGKHFNWWVGGPIMIEWSAPLPSRILFLIVPVLFCSIVRVCDPH